MIYSKATIKSISESIGIPRLKDGITTAMAQDVEYRLHEIIVEAAKFMHHSRRTKLTVGDVNRALRVRNVEPVYGFESGRPSKFHRAQTGIDDDVFYVDDEMIDLDAALDEALPSVPPSVAYTAHWLAIEGVQPRIQQNPVEAEPDVQAGVKRQNTSNGADAVETILEVKHVLSKELQLYYECITESLRSSDSVVRATAVSSIAADAGIHQLVTYFVQYVATTVKSNLRNVDTLTTALAVARAVRTNPHLFVEPYMHQLIPSLLTCVVSRQLGEPGSSAHWALRDNAAEQVSEICKQFGHVYHTLQPRVARTLLRAFLDPTKPLSTHYGAITGLSALGTSVIRVLLLPNMRTYMALLDVEMEKQEEEARMCQNALVRALKKLAEHYEDEVGLSHMQKHKLAEVVGTTLAGVVYEDPQAGKIMGAVAAAVAETKLSNQS